MDRFGFFSLCACLISSLTNPSYASTLMLPDEIELNTKVMQAFDQNLDTTASQHAKDSVWVEAKFDTDKESFHDVRWVVKTCSKQTELDILDAICLITATSSDRIKGEDYTFEFKFGKTVSEPGYILARNGRKLNSYSNQSVFHAIPMAVLRQYPGLFSYSELTESEHLRNLPNGEVSEGTVQKLRKPWIEFFRVHPNASKEEVLELEKVIDSHNPATLTPIKN